MEQQTRGAVSQPDYLEAQQEKNRRALRLMQGMRAMTEEEIAERQRRMAPGMINAPYKGDAGLRNSWVFESPSHDAEAVDETTIKRPAWWRRLLGVFLRRG